MVQLRAFFQGWFAPMWIGLYNRACFDFSGFEHVFVGEFRDNGVQGYHNWYSFYLQEKKGEINWFGYLDKTDFGTAVSIEATFLLTFR